MSGPDYTLEQDAILRGARHVAGVDEVGRGPLAGPVTAAAVILDIRCIPDGLDDSKKLTPSRRALLAEAIMARCDWAVAHASVEEIDRLNILRASHLAMCRALAGLRRRPCVALIDGNMLPRDLDLPGQAVVGGDARCLSIAAASIIAKVFRDRIMVDLAQQHPGYGWDVNAGYPTPAHRQALLDLGITPYHRRSFAPVHNILCKAEIASC
ncbi:ribonuclease HII [Paracoccus yeei]|uniref:Ribonuclease HII n=1 Tax=Paracoccus yeei TaxID=147645 RepID=A0A386UN73_9RHOB|nr:ribonuclease HII [Paracoccus yeei]AYF02205.1 ribonuclease HII [Paracoccus yeei]OWJ97327.1 ribonuclease HII [Paracoccus yeei]